MKRFSKSLHFFISFKPQFSEQSIFCQMCALPIAIYFALNAIRILSLQEIEKKIYFNKYLTSHDDNVDFRTMCTYDSAKKHQKAHENKV